MTAEDRQETPYQAASASGVLPSDPERPPLRPGTQLGEYHIEGLLGRGGFALVYRGLDTRLDRPVAIKECFPAGVAQRVSGHRGTLMPRPDVDPALFDEALSFFHNEAKILATVSHAGLPQLIRLVEANDTAYLVLALMEGVILDQHLPAPGSGLREEQVRPLLEGVLEATAALHDIGVLHRDITPANILIDANGQVMLLDLGSARALDAPGSLVETLTPGFAAPERYWHGGNEGAWSDIYSIGALGYSLLTGAIPPPADTRWRGDTLPPTTAFAAGRAKHAFLAGVDRALAVDPEERWPSADHWLAALAGSPLPEPERTAANAGRGGGRSGKRRMPATDGRPQPLPPTLRIERRPPPRAGLQRGDAEGMSPEEAKRVQAEKAAQAKKKAKGDPKAEDSDSRAVMPTGRQRGADGRTRLRLKGADPGDQLAKWDQETKGPSLTVVAFVLLLLAVLGGGGWYLWDSLQDKPAAGTAQPEPRSGPDTQPPPPAPEVMVLRVQEDGGGDVDTISAAIAKAEAGTEIRIAPGRYRENLTLDKPLTLVGLGPDANKIQIIPRGGPCLKLGPQADGSRIEGLSLRNGKAGGSGGSDAGLGTPCVDIEAGTVELVNIRIGSAAGAGLWLHGNAEARMRGSLIQGVSGHGILIEGEARLRLDGSRIHNTGKAGLRLRGAVDPEVSNTEIDTPGQAGILVSDGAKGRFRKLTISHARYAGIEIRSGGDPLVEASTITGGRQSGVFVYEGGKGRLIGNIITRNAFSGVVIGPDGDPVLENNRVESNHDHGVLLQPEARGLLSNNVIKDNRGHGLAIDMRAQTRREENALEGNLEPQIRVGRVSE